MCGICFSLAPLLPPSTQLDAHTTTQPNLEARLQSLDISPQKLDSLVSSLATPSTLTNRDEMWSTLTAAVQTRGPDYKGSVQRIVENIEMRFHAAILHMRGNEVTKQPFVAENGDVFLWNGEIFSGLEVGSEENDGRVLFDRILRAELGSEGFIGAIGDVEGPYAFVYYQASTNHIYYGRDPLGRRSLLLHRPTASSPTFYLTSNGPAIDFALQDFEEVSAGAIFRYDLGLVGTSEWLMDSEIGLTSYPRVPKSSAHDSNTLTYPFNRLSTAVPLPTDLLPLLDATTALPITPELQRCIATLLHELRFAIRSRVALLPLPSTSPSAAKARVAVLFSGGLDCTTLALLADGEMAEGEEIDLINVAFENPRVLAGNRTLDEGKNEAKRKRVRVKTKRREERLSGIVVEEVGESVVEEVEVKKGMYDVPDRLTGYESWAELKRLRPNRRWNFVEVNVTYEEMLSCRDKVIELMRPARTIMDLSISLAFFFAARSHGALHSLDRPSTPYVSTAKVLLSGLGADELFGGYARHRKTFFYNPPTLASPSAPWLALLAELQMDLDRIPYRNLGRDDRIISHHGKEARYPFLAENVVEKVAEMGIWLKCDMRFAEGVGDKLLLRALAGELGLEGARGLKKRAIHFGARTAKMELNSGKDRGEDSL